MALLTAASDKDLDKLIVYLLKNKRGRQHRLKSNQQEQTKRVGKTTIQTTPETKSTMKIIQDITIGDINQMTAALFPEEVIVPAPAS